MLWVVAMGGCYGWLPWVGGRPGRGDGETTRHKVTGAHSLFPCVLCPYWAAPRPTRPASASPQNTTPASEPGRIVARSAMLLAMFQQCLQGRLTLQSGENSRWLGRCLPYSHHIDVKAWLGTTDSQFPFPLLSMATSQHVLSANKSGGRPPLPSARASATASPPFWTVVLEV